jgi:hypothetical protein
LRTLSEIHILQTLLTAHQVRARLKDDVSDFLFAQFTVIP